MLKIWLAVKNRIFNLFNKKIVKICKSNNVNNSITNIFDYNTVILNRLDQTDSLYYGSKLYGFQYGLKRYSGYCGIINASIEHGPNLDSEEGGEYLEKNRPALIVQSNQRKKFIEKMNLGRPVFAVGSQIYYANSIFREYDLDIVKKNLGKTLLIYPLHDIEDFHYIQNVEKFIEFVKKIKGEHDYQTVLVSMYFVDIERGRHIRFQQEGWTILSAGRRTNYDFADMMKTIISMSDFAIFQAYTSAIGFCTYMGVPSMIYHQPFLFSENGKEELQTFMGIKDSMMTSLESVFADYCEEITKEKYDFANYWFGFEETLKADDLNLLFQFLDELRVGMSKNRMISIANKKKYLSIKNYLMDSLNKV